MNDLSRRTKTLIAFFVIVVGGGVLTYWAAVSQGVSPAFTEARMQGALIAQGIVELSQQSTRSLDEINQLDRQGQYKDALAKTEVLIAQNQAVKEKALALSRELETMTKALDSIDSEEARQLALQAISNRLAMITRLIAYSNSLGQLLDTLKLRFSGTAYGQNQTIRQLVEQINIEVTAINNFDREARTAMDQFDAAIHAVKGQ